MINFENAKYLKLRKVDNDDIGRKVAGILTPTEKVIGVYKGARDYVLFTDKRFMAVNVQGITGKKQEITSTPYKTMTAFSIQTSGVLDMDCELTVCVGALGEVQFEFSGTTNVVEIGRMISQCMFD